MKILLTALFLTLTSLTVFASDCSLYISHQDANIETEPTMFLETISAELSGRGFWISDDMEESRFLIHLDLSHPKVFTLLLRDKIKQVEVTSGGKKDIRSLEMALRKISPCIHIH